MFGKSASILLAVIWIVNPAKAEYKKVEKPDIGPCDCEAYLKNKAWNYLKYSGIEVGPEFCCKVSFAEQFCGTDTHCKEIKPPCKQDSYGYKKCPPSHHKCETIAKDPNCVADIFKKYGDKYPDKKYVGGDGYGVGDQAYGLKDGEGITSGYHHDRCAYSYTWNDYISCVVQTYFGEAIRACYCYYRSYLDCTEHDCSEDLENDVQLERTLLVPLSVPVFVDNMCNQCPNVVEHVDDGWGDAHKVPYGGGYGGYGYDAYLDGLPYEDCLGYCVLVDKAGLPSASGCVFNGVFYNVGDTFTDDCNTCRCQANGAAACTLIACP